MRPAKTELIAYSAADAQREGDCVFILIGLKHAGRFYFSASFGCP